MVPRPDSRADLLTLAEEAKKPPQPCRTGSRTSDWDVFAEGTDLEGHMSTVLSYMNFCDCFRDKNC